MNKKCFKAFYRFSDLENGEISYERIPVKEQFNIVQKVQGDGVLYEFMISFYELGGRLNARMEIFDDAFVAFEKNCELFDELSNLKRVTPDEIESILVKLDYIKLTR